MWLMNSYILEAKAVGDTRKKVGGSTLSLRKDLAGVRKRLAWELRTLATAEPPERCASPGSPWAIAGEPHKPIHRATDLASSGVVDHVSLPRQDRQRALRCLLVQPTGVILGINNGVCVTREDCKRNPQPRIVRLEQGGSYVQCCRVLRAGPLLHRINRDLDWESGLETGGHRFRPEHVPEHLRREQMANSLGHHGTGEVTQAGDRKRGCRGHVRTPGRVVVAGQKHEPTQVTPACDGEREGYEGAPGVAHDDRPLNIQPLQYAMHEMRLGGSGPDPQPWSIRVAEAGPVNGKDPVVFRKLVQEAADHEVLSHGSVAMDQNHRATFATGDVVDPHPVHLNKAAQRSWSTGLLGLFGLHSLRGCPNRFTGLLDSFVPLPDRRSGDLGAGFQGLGGLLGHETGSAPGGLPKHA